MRLSLLLTFPVAFAAYTSKRAEEFEALVHDQQAPCLPADDSASWSCLRLVPLDQVHMPKKKFGFADHKEATDGRRVGDTDDGNRFSNKDIRALSDGPGYLKMNMTDALRQTFKWYEESGRKWLRKEGMVAGGYLNMKVHPTDFAHLDYQRQNTVVSEMAQVLQWWTKQKLLHSMSYGIRVYRRNNLLINHFDRQDTHAASVVMQVYQDVDEGWPLEVSHDGKTFEVYLQPGEMVLYEGARIAHGRPMRLNGTEFANMFSHFRPADWSEL